MRILSRPASDDRRSAVPTTSAARRLAVAMASAATLSVALLLVPATAGAFIHKTFGLQQRKPVFLRHAPLQYHAGPVIHASDSYAIYWDPLELYNSDWMRVIDKYFGDVGSESGGLGDVFALNAQYGETGYNAAPAASASAKEAHAANQSTFRGAYTDTDSYPSVSCPEPAHTQVVCLTDPAIKTELEKVIKSGALPGASGTVPGAKSTPVYYILTPPGVTVCAEAATASTCSDSEKLELESTEIEEKKILHPAETGICGYHSTINPASATPTVYAVQPWVAGHAGLFVESMSPLKTSDSTADVPPCQDGVALDEPNQIDELTPFAAYGVGLADVIVNDLADEQSNIVVDPLLNGWYQDAPTAEEGSPEQGDMCQWSFAGSPGTPNEGPTHANSASDEEISGAHYYLHWAFNSSGYITGKGLAGCWQGVDLGPRITAPNPVNVGDVVGLDANESNITLAAAPMGPRVAKEETRTAAEVQASTEENTKLNTEIAKLVTIEIATLNTEIAKLATDIPTLHTALVKLASEENTLATEEKTLTAARSTAEGKSGGLSLSEQEEFERNEKRLASKRQRIASEKATDEATKSADEERKLTDERDERFDTEHKERLQEDKVIVVEDEALAKNEQKLAQEHLLIQAREPFQAPIYKWDFGYKENGVEVTEEGENKASVFHAFPCAKTYTVSLIVLDGGGFERELPEGVTKTVNVEGKPCEEAAPASGGSGGSGGSAGSTQTPPAGTGAPAGSTATKTTRAPVATAAVSSRSLKTVLASGLVVRYSVNEQVAGHFEVLLAASTARRIGLHGSPATGLAKGTPAQIVIGKAILVTTKGGASTVKIKFGKTTAKLLRRLGKVSLTVRMVVRNASPTSPATTTVLSVVTLTH